MEAGSFYFLSNIRIKKDVLDAGTGKERSDVHSLTYTLSKRFSRLESETSMSQKVSNYPPREDQIISRVRPTCHEFPGMDGILRYLEVQ